MKFPRDTKPIQNSTTHKIATGCGTMLLIVCADRNGITDLIAKLGKSGGCANAQVECIGALLTSSIKSGVDPQVLIRDLIGVRCSKPMIENGLGEDIYSCGDAIGKFLRWYLSNNFEQPMEIGAIENEPDPEYLAASEA